MERDAETIFSNAGSKLTGTGFFLLEAVSCAGASSVPWIEKARQRAARWQDEPRGLKGVSIVLGTRIPGFGIGPQRFRQFIPTHRGGIKKLLQKIQGSGVDAQPFVPGRGF